MSVVKVDEGSFESEVVKSEKTTIVDFYADWCGPCKMMSPIIDSVAEELGDSVKVCKVNTDDNMNLAEQYGIMSIPTIIIFKNGEIVNRFSGVRSKSEIIDAIK